MLTMIQWVSVNTPFMIHNPGRFKLAWNITDKLNYLHKIYCYYIYTFQYLPLFF